MPPKKPAQGASKKTEVKKKEKIIEDKTFGLKNKKGAKQQKFIQQVEKQVKFGNNPRKVVEEDKTSKKDEKKKVAEELNMLFKPVQDVSKGADPKSVLCAFFKQGTCQKGLKCKFSHDLSLDRKSEKRSLYDDSGAGEAPNSMDNWDESELQDVVNKKHGEANKGLPPTTIICKYFLDAVEESKYGWFWECPNGPTCHYRHALPPGFILKKDKKKMDEQKEQITLEELIEKERAALGTNVTRITLETFKAWKEKKRAEKVSKLKLTVDKKKADFKAGKMFGISGREMFEFNPDLVQADDEEAAEGIIEREPDEDDQAQATSYKAINLDDLALLAQENDGSGTVAPTVRQFGVRIVEGADGVSASSSCAATGGDVNSAQARETDEAIAAAMAATAGGSGSDGDDDSDAAPIDEPINEDLFAEEDLDDIDQDLETLTLDS